MRHIAPAHQHAQQLAHTAVVVRPDDSIAAAAAAAPPAGLWAPAWLLRWLMATLYGLATAGTSVAGTLMHSEWNPEGRNGRWIWCDGVAAVAVFDHFCWV
jgi:hypothetical protein